MITPTRQRSLGTRFRPLLISACFVAVGAIMAFHSLTQYINQDEEQYVAAAHLMRHMRLYEDFLYNQLPIYPLILSGVLTLLPGESPFLLARLLSAAFATGSIFVFFALARRLSENLLFSFVATCLFASAPLMLLAFG
jgi:hypothetical protein